MNKVAVGFSQSMYSADEGTNLTLTFTLTEMNPIDDVLLDIPLISELVVLPGSAGI